MGNREGLSFNDIKLVNLMYDCAGQLAMFSLQYLIPAGYGSFMAVEIML